MLNGYNFCSYVTSRTQDLIERGEEPEHRTAGVTTEPFFLGLLMVRGGIAIGPMRHRESVAFGPALIDAYELESRFAVYPRILVSDPMARWILDQPIPQNPNTVIEPPAEYTTYCQDVLRKDSDDLYFLDFLSYSAMASEQLWKLSDGNRGGLLKRFSPSLISQLANQDEPRIREKLEWMARYFNATIEERRLKLKPIPV